jgi:hypothetical protein
MSAVGSRAVMGASRWLEALIPAGPISRTVRVAIATKAKARAIREILVFVMHLIFIIHLIFKDLNSRSVERVYGNTHQGAFNCRRICTEQQYEQSGRPAFLMTNGLGFDLHI